MSRPSDFTQDTADRICERLADGESLRTICQADDMPARSTVFYWLADRPPFQAQYARAREAQADGIFDEMIEIADDGVNDWIEKRNRDGSVAGYEENGEAIRRSALRLDARKWVLGKMQPKKYSDRIDVNHSGAVTIDTGPDLSGLDDTELRVLKHLLDKGAAPSDADAAER